MRAVAGLILVGALSGCRIFGFVPYGCDEDTDCRADEVCEAELCIAAPDRPADAGAPAPGPDAGAADAGADAGLTDAGLADAGLADAGPLDAGPLDAGAVDAGPVEIVRAADDFNRGLLSDVGPAPGVSWVPDNNVSIQPASSALSADGTGNAIATLGNIAQPYRLRFIALFFEDNGALTVTVNSEGVETGLAVRVAGPGAGGSTLSLTEDGQELRGIVDPASVRTRASSAAPGAPELFVELTVNDGLAVLSVAERGHGSDGGFVRAVLSTTVAGTSDGGDLKIGFKSFNNDSNAVALRDIVLVENPRPRPIIHVVADGFNRAFLDRAEHPDVLWTADPGAAAGIGGGAVQAAGDEAASVAVSQGAVIAAPARIRAELQVNSSRDLQVLYNASAQGNQGVGFSVGDDISLRANGVDARSVNKPPFPDRFFVEGRFEPTGALFLLMRRDGFGGPLVRVLSADVTPAPQSSRLHIAWSGATTAPTRVERVVVDEVGFQTDDVIFFDSFGRDNAADLGVAEHPRSSWSEVQGSFAIAGESFSGDNGAGLVLASATAGAVQYDAASGAVRMRARVQLNDRVVCIGFNGAVDALASSGVLVCLGPTNATDDRGVRIIEQERVTPVSGHNLGGILYYVEMIASEPGDITAVVSTVDFLPGGSEVARQTTDTFEDAGPPVIDAGPADGDQFMIRLGGGAAATLIRDVALERLP